MHLDQARQYIAPLDARAEHRSPPVAPACSMDWRFFGAGRPLALIHGGYGRWLHWIANIEALAGRRTVALADRPRCGDSDDLPRAALVRWLRRAGEAQAEALRHHLYAPMLHGTPASNALAYEACACAVKATRYRSRGEVQRLRLSAILAQFRTPIIFMGREHDVTATPELVRDELTASGPDRVVRSLPNAGHCIRCEPPQMVNAERLRWFGV